QGGSMGREQSKRRIKEVRDGAAGSGVSDVGEPLVFGLAWLSQGTKLRLVEKKRQSPRAQAFISWRRRSSQSTGWKTLAIEFLSCLRRLLSLRGRDKKTAHVELTYPIHGRRNSIRLS